MDAVTERDIRSMPKVELHVHLNGSITEETAALLARRHGAEPESALILHDGRYPGSYPDFQGFLDAYLAANAFVRTPDDLELVAAEFVRGQAAQNVVYSEAIFTAMIFVRNGMDPTAMWAALRRGLATAGPSTRVGLVVDVIRDHGREEAEATLKLVDAADAPIVGLGLTGIEGTVPTDDFIGYRAEARRRGLGFEVHAGEMGPPSSVVESLDILEADRIGHGVASIRDPELVERLVREGVVLDVCPTSNIAIGEYASIEQHPFAALRRAGVRMTISSDDPPFFGTTLTDELLKVAGAAGMTATEVLEMQALAARSSFASAALRAELVREIGAWGRAVPA